ncbi:uncharacterized protein PG986_007863 [Apiospora aurea]|uniref:Uncharacterized protein n=1 Tax=Apiospora aurea TaxID=335848 RepID=A0ABR1QDS6_9PEZI
MCADHHELLAVEAHHLLVWAHHHRHLVWGSSPLCVRPQRRGRLHLEKHRHHELPDSEVGQSSGSAFLPSLRHLNFVLSSPVLAPLPGVDHLDLDQIDHGLAAGRTAGLIAGRLPAWLSGQMK